MQVFLETDRLLLRRFTEADGENLFNLDSDPEVMRFLSSGRPTPREAIEKEILPRFLQYHAEFENLGFWVAIERASGEFLGWFHLRPPKNGTPGDLEIGYRLRRAAWGKGYATEGSLALIRKAFAELGAERVVAYTLAVNKASRRVMEKAGLRLERSFYQPELSYIEGFEQGTVEYVLKRQDWQAREALRPAAAAAGSEGG